MSVARLNFTSESITEGHPDKVADRLSDGVLDALLRQDPSSRVACETMIKSGLVVIAGEITSTGAIDYHELVRSTLEHIGYVDEESGFNLGASSVIVQVSRQSDDIKMGVDTGGAGDQGMMFGYACNETPELMPAPIAFSHRITRRLAEVRRSGEVPFLLPDGKSQVTVEYENGKPARVATVVVAAQHRGEVHEDTVRSSVIERVVRPAIPGDLLDGDTQFRINRTGRFVIGGPQGDCGLTGRKIIADTYGGMGRHGGGAFSGKDPSKVDRSASYMARYAAKNVVAAGLASRCEVRVAYVIGDADPVAIDVDTFGTGAVDDRVLARAVASVFPFQPGRIIEALDLRRPIYTPTSAYGHFGREEDLDVFTWERRDRVAELRRAAG